MVPLTSLWLPIVLSAVIVFAASFVIHMALRYHRGNFRQVPGEDQVMAALRSIPPGNYFMPYAPSPAAMKAPDYLERKRLGPIAVLNVMASPSMGVSLAQWFVYCLVVSVLAAYVAGRALGPGAEYSEVFRFAGVTAFIGYCVALWQNSIWYKIRWTTTLKQTFDGLIYGLLTGGTFGGFWPGT